MKSRPAAPVSMPMAAISMEPSSTASNSTPHCGPKARVTRSRIMAWLNASSVPTMPFASSTSKVRAGVASSAVAVAG
jgi:hypothetical protein